MSSGKFVVDLMEGAVNAVFGLITLLAIIAVVSIGGCSYLLWS